MVNEYKSPVKIQVYLGSGSAGERLRENLLKGSQEYHSLSEMVVALMRKADPSLFKGVDNGKSK